MKYVANKYVFKRKKGNPSLFTTEEVRMSSRRSALKAGGIFRERCSMDAKLFNKNHERSHMQTITKRSPNVYRGYGVCTGATWQEEGGRRRGG